MEDTIRFVLETPHTTQSQKKRPRLVTSCDNCRLKKVKCIQTANEKCEACSNAQVPCRFRDRERYFAERSRIMAGSSNESGRRSAQSSRASSSSAGWGSGNGTPSPDREVIPPTVVPSNAHTRSAMYPQPVRDEFSIGGSSYPQMSWSEYPQSTSMTNAYSSQASNTLDGTHWDYGTVPSQFTNAASPSTYGMDFTGQTSSQPTQTPLFDLRHPDRPHAHLMAYFIQAFFEHMPNTFPFMSYEVVVKQFLEQSLTPLLSSCIAALGARHVECPEVTSIGVSNVQAAYCTNAETLLAAQSSFPTLETLHATILLAWAEYKRSQTSAFCLYAQMAVQMSWQLGLGDENTIALTQDQYQQNLYRNTLACVRHLNTSANQMSMPPPLH